jgi:class 3 adenylate cyclase
LLIFEDIVGFTEISSRTSPKEIVSLLNELFSTFDELCAKYDVEKIKTIGDAYVAVGGLSNQPKHAEAVLEMALDMLHSDVLRNNCLGVKLKLRIGVASGPVIAGVIGIYKWCYDLYGHTVKEAEK